MTRSDVLQVMREMGRKGGKRRMKALSPERRSEIARMGGAARWKDQKPPRGTKAARKIAPC